VSSRLADPGGDADGDIERTEHGRHRSGRAWNLCFAVAPRRSCSDRRTADVSIRWRPVCGPGPGFSMPFNADPLAALPSDKSAASTQGIRRNDRRGRAVFDRPRSPWRRSGRRRRPRQFSRRCSGVEPGCPRPRPRRSTAIPPAVRQRRLVRRATGIFQDNVRGASSLAFRR